MRVIVSRGGVQALADVPAAQAAAWLNSGFARLPEPPRIGVGDIRDDRKVIQAVLDDTETAPIAAIVEPPQNAMQPRLQGRKRKHRR